MIELLPLIFDNHAIPPSGESSVDGCLSAALADCAATITAKMNRIVSFFMMFLLLVCVVWFGVNVSAAPALVLAEPAVRGMRWVTVKVFRQANG